MLKRLLGIIELWLWKHNFISIGNIPYFPIGGGKSSSKSSKAEQTAAEQSVEAQRKAGEETKAAALEAERKLIEAGGIARGQMLAAAEPTAEETERRERYKAKALTPGETLMTQAGPISQAVARRIQERIDTPGLDYSRDLPAYTEGITAPLWRALKGRGIVPPPGAEGGGGLATQQYMKGAEPALAALRAEAISGDITRGERYGTEARSLQQLYEQVENALAEAIRGRQFEAGIKGAEAAQLGTREGAPYGVTGAQAKGAGYTTAAQINQEEVQRRYDRARAEEKAIGDMVAQLITTAVTTAAAGGAGAAGAGTIPPAPPKMPSLKQSGYWGSTPPSAGGTDLPLALQMRLAGR